MNEHFTYNEGVGPKRNWFQEYEFPEGIITGACHQLAHRVHNIIQSLLQEELNRHGYGYLGLMNYKDVVQCSQGGWRHYVVKQGEAEPLVVMSITFDCPVMLNMGLDLDESEPVTLKESFVYKTYPIKPKNQ